MRIGLISDTHVPSAAKEPPHEVAAAFDGVDLILHAGDIYLGSCLDWLERIAPVRAVELGSKTHFDGDPRVAEKLVMELEGHTIGMVHDLMPQGFDELRPGDIARHPLQQELPALLAKFFGVTVDIAVFGHTHVAMLEEHHGVMLINPGSPVLPRQTRRLGQVAILELTEGSRTARIVDLAQFS